MKFGEQNVSFLLKVIISCTLSADFMLYLHSRTICHLQLAMYKLVFFKHKIYVGSCSNDTFKYKTKIFSDLYLVFNNKTSTFHFNLSVSCLGNY